MPKLPKQYVPILTGFLLSGLMTLIISVVATFRNVGLTEDFVTKWLAAYVNGWVISFLTVLVVAPLVRKFVAALTR
jgi:uncharacterized membrane protein (DUF373 family)